jgi:hypothetical protein
MPVYMLWNSTIPKTPRRMIRVVFATSITTTAIGAVHAIYVMGSNHLLEGYTAHFEVHTYRSPFKAHYYTNFCIIHLGRCYSHDLQPPRDCYLVLSDPPTRT